MGGFFPHLNDVEWFTIQQVLNIKEKYSYQREVQLLNIIATHYNGWMFFHLNDVKWFTIQQVLNIIATHYNGWIFFPL